MPAQTRDGAERVNVNIVNCLMGGASAEPASTKVKTGKHGGAVIKLRRPNICDKNSLIRDLWGG